MDAGFSGQFELIGSGSPDARLDVEFTTAFPEAGLVYAAKAGATLPRLVLSGGERFASARLPAAQGGKPHELFDLKNDLSESTNLLETQPEVAARLRTLLMQHLEESGAEIPVANPDFRPK